MVKIQKAADLLVVMDNPAFASFLIRDLFLLAMVWAGRRTQKFLFFGPPFFPFAGGFLLSPGEVSFSRETRFFYLTPSGKLVRIDVQGVSVVHADRQIFQMQRAKGAVDCGRVVGKANIHCARYGDGVLHVGKPDPDK